MASRLSNQYDSALHRAMSRSVAADQDFYRRATNFDPYAAIESTALGSYNLLAKQLDEAIKNLRGSQVAMGRLNTGFATADEDRLVAEGRDQLINALLANAMNAAQMDLSHMGMLGSYAGQQQQNYYDLLSGGLDRETAERNARQQKRGGLWGAVGAIGGAALGSVIPGVGTMLGAQLGGLLGNQLGSR